ncbi:uncharacterized protein [Hyperolius riggenbachi]|uniref:uncharacterized protein n=1 Tax=Hyperolius riggenbachi TaxID=752182 RepID=UPI0035A329EB
MGCCDHLVAGIFSRDDSTTYQWLTNAVLETSGVKDVRPVLITNNWSDFMAEVDKCSFAILYHSKLRGRLNITDVNDSLYDAELKFLAKKFGTKKVIVVVGDLKEASDEQKKRMLMEQKTIGCSSRDLILFFQATDRNALSQANKIQHLQKIITKIAWEQFTEKYATRLVVFLLGVLFIGIIAGCVLFIEYHHHPTADSPLTTEPAVPVTFMPEKTTTAPSIVTNFSEANASSPLSTSEMMKATSPQTVDISTTANVSSSP